MRASVVMVPPWPDHLPRAGVVILQPAVQSLAQECGHFSEACVGESFRQPHARVEDSDIVRLFPPCLV